MWRRILAILVARNREFYRDKAGLGWNIVMPLLIVFAFAFVFTGEPGNAAKIGVVTGDVPLSETGSPLLELRHVRFLAFTDMDEGMVKVQRQQLDMLVDLRDAPVYWINTNSPKGYVAERLLLGAYGQEGSGPRRETVTGRALRYVDWVLPGVLGMNVMFSSLWGVGWVIVRYRKNGVLRRLKATPLSAFEFLAAQVISRLGVVLAATAAVYAGADMLLDFVMRGSFLILLLVYVSGALCLISLGLLVACRLRSEEMADGILNVMSWPMLLLSGVWFSMEDTNVLARLVSEFLPLTHLVNATRGIMVDGHGIAEVALEMGILFSMSAVFLTIAARAFRWE